MTRLERSYVHGAATTPLIGETIGVHLDRVAALSPDADALVVRHGLGQFRRRTAVMML
jgi:fatty-acyl-CoA synthase